VSAAAQAACEAFWHVIRGRDGLRNDPADAWPWAQSQGAEEAWQAAADAAIAARQPQPAPDSALTVDDFYAERAEKLHRAGERDAARSDLARVKRAVLNPGTHQAKIRKILAIVDPIPDDEPQDDNDAQPAPELAAAMAETRNVRAVVRELIGMFHGIPGGYGARTSIGRLNRLAKAADVEPPQPGDPLSAVVADELGRLHDSIGNLAAGLKLSADASRPSKKTQIEDGVAAALLGILDPR
jgi:hypothetical protein